MIRQTFYRRFRKVAPKFSWVVLTNGNIRGFNNGLEHCPLTAVKNLDEPSTWYDLTEGYEAGLALGLSKDDSGDILDAADDGLSSSVKIRQTLLKICGLTED